MLSAAVNLWSEYETELGTGAYYESCSFVNTVYTNHLNIAASTDEKYKLTTIGHKKTLIQYTCTS